MDNSTLKGGRLFNVESITFHSLEKNRVSLTFCKLWLSRANTYSS